VIDGSKFFDCDECQSENSVGGVGEDWEIRDVHWSERLVVEMTWFDCIRLTTVSFVTFRNKREVNGIEECRVNLKFRQDDPKGEKGWERNFYPQGSPKKVNVKNGLIYNKICLNNIISFLFENIRSYLPV